MVISIVSTITPQQSETDGYFLVARTDSSMYVLSGPYALLPEVVKDWNTLTDQGSSPEGNSLAQKRLRCVLKTVYTEITNVE